MSRLAGDRPCRVSLRHAHRPRAVPRLAASQRPLLRGGGPMPAAHLRQMAYMRLTGEMRKGSDLARLRLLLSVPSPRRW